MATKNSFVRHQIATYAGQDATMRVLDKRFLSSSRRRRPRVVSHASAVAIAFDSIKE